MPIVRAIQATSPDLVFLASYPLDSAGMVRAVNEVGLKTKMFGGGLVGLQYAALKQQLGSLLNGITTFDTYVPEPTLSFHGIKEFLTRYQARAPPKESIRSASTRRRSPMRACKSWRKQSRQPKASIKS